MSVFSTISTDALNVKDADGHPAVTTIDEIVKLFEDWVEDKKAPVGPDGVVTFTTTAAGDPRLHMSYQYYPLEEEPLEVPSGCPGFPWDRRILE